MKVPFVTLSNKVKIPQLGLGTYLLNGETCFNAVRIALNLGYTHIDTADFYGNQTEIGKAIKSTGIARKKLFLTTKVWVSNLRYDNVIKTCDKALGELDTEYIDLILIHWPYNKVPFKETFDAMKKLADEKKIRSVGVSNFTVRHIREAVEASQVPITINQVEFHPFLYQKELLEFCMKKKIRITAYAPLARGLVYTNEVIKQISEKHKKTPAQVTLRWLLQKGIIAIPKASTEVHISENMDIFDFVLGEKDISQMDSFPQKRLVQPGFAEFDYL